MRIATAASCGPHTQVVLKRASQIFLCDWHRNDARTGRKRAFFTPGYSQSGQYSHHSFDLVDVVSTPSEKTEKPTPENERLEITELGEFFSSHPFDDPGRIDLFVGNDMIDRRSSNIGLDALAIEILRQPPF